jgi:hypothetical protein
MLSWKISTKEKILNQRFSSFLDLLFCAPNMNLVRELVCGLKLLQPNMRKLLPLVALEWQGCALMTCGDAFVLAISQGLGQ